MKKDRKAAIIRITTALVTVIFGGFTVFVGGRTLLGYSDPGYTAFLPLLIFNFVMGFIYVTTGLLIWKGHKKALTAAKTVFLLNLSVFLMISILYLSSDMVAMESVIAMTFRTGVWFVIFMVIR